MLDLDAVVDLDSSQYDLDGNPKVIDHGGTILYPISLAPWKRPKKKKKKPEPLVFVANEIEIRDDDDEAALVLLI
jgi:hypothetical protein